MNHDYRKLYDRLAPFYDHGERLYRWIARAPDHRLEYAGELEVPAGGRVLEVSIGTGANLRYLRPDATYYKAQVKSQKAKVKSGCVIRRGNSGLAGGQATSQKSKAEPRQQEWRDSELLTFDLCLLTFAFPSTAVERL
jgi:hypothetical protein